MTARDIIGSPRSTPLNARNRPPAPPPPSRAVNGATSRPPTPTAAASTPTPLAPMPRSSATRTCTTSSKPKRNIVAEAKAMSPTSPGSVLTTAIPFTDAAPQALVNLRDHQLRHLRRPAPALAVHASRVPSAPHRAGLQHQCRRDQERHGVGRERRARVGDGHDQRAEGRPGEVGDLGHDALEGVGSGEVVLAHQRRRGRDGRRPVRHRADRAGDGQRDREGR